MSKYVKDLLVKEFETKFSGVEDFIVLETKGIGGNDNNEMRGVLKKKGVKLHVVKNSAMRRALSNLGRESALGLFEAGPCTIAYGGDSIVDVAKEMAEWGKKLKEIQFKGAFVDGSAVDGQGALALSKMPTRAELQGEIVMLLLSPSRRVAGAIAGPGGIVSGCVKGLVEKLEEAA